MSPTGGKRKNKETIHLLPLFIVASTEKNFVVGEKKKLTGLMRRRGEKKIKKINNFDSYCFGRSTRPENACIHKAKRK